MECDPVEIMFIENLDEEEEQRLLFFNHQVDEYMEWEDEYQLYLNNMADDDYFANMNILIENYRNDGTDNHWCNWQEVPEEYKLLVNQILIYQVEKNICLPITELQDDTAFYNYLLFIANVVRNN